MGALKARTKAVVDTETGLLVALMVAQALVKDHLTRGVAG
jgi:hypothetical protein